MTGWTKTPNGYELAGIATLERNGARWTLKMANGRTFDLGRKASFDPAESLIQAN